MKIYAVLFLFFGLYLSVCIWIFLIVTDSVRKISSHGFLRTRRNFVEAVDRHFIALSDNKTVTEEEVLLLCGTLKTKKMKRYFLQRFIYYSDKIQDKSRIKEYFRPAFPYFKEMLQFGRNMHYSEKSYRMMLLGEFRQDLEEINLFILDALEDDSFDVRANALRALSVIGNSSYFNKGLMKACSSDQYFNPRHISEMIGSFEGSIDELRWLMLDSFYGNPDSYRHLVIRFLTENVINDSMDFVLGYLHDHVNNKEIVIACLRYFSVCEIRKKARESIMQLLYKEDFEIRAVAVTLAPKYFKGDEEVILLLLGERFLRSKDWYVRKNSAAALVRIGLDKEELLTNLLVDDNYAKEALIYAMFDAGMTTYEEFVELGGGMNGAA
ncbi:HEAT repeat domain-containing protein [Sinanaerobacter chloroacetimidivorans]|uniref:HEAT repeat domain-containing protein n=1 Tax=Sinanaerobacter chloroacetimidivorans TaxID=2818044 RepID=A0A8J7W370_9FIRM|nr:HEAT repeat domain-containing protein [Sinanaerobacter chloroacetimidivorans]MBR0599644.1 HEAT repeat domain-containing protein [Sinanaerobacter chloroacetimidivorans]